MKSELTTIIISTVSTVVAILALLVAIQTKNEWKVQKRYDEFKSFYEKLEAQKTAAFKIIGIISVYKKPVETAYLTSKEENFIWLRNELAPKCIDFAEKMTIANSDIFLAYMDPKTVKAFELKKESEKKLISLFNLQEWKTSSDAKTTEIEEEIKRFIDATDFLILEAGKSLKSKKTIKL